MSDQTPEAQRLQLLMALYDAVDGDTGRMVKLSDVANRAGLGTAFSKARSYLSQRDMLSVETMGKDGLCRITAAGIDAVEEARRDPSEETDGFAPLNMINIMGDVHGSAIMQGSDHAFQQVHVESEKTGELLDHIREIKGQIDELGLDQVTKVELAADIATLEAQLEGPRPKWSIVRETAKSVWRITENTAAGVAAAAIAKLSG